MHETRTRLAFVGVLIIAVTLVVIANQRAANPAPAGPTIDIQLVQTDAVATYVHGLTRTAEALPSSTPTGTSGAGASASAVGALSTTPSCLRLRFVKDVTIPDNTQVNPAQVFTKTWLVENNGTCAWQPGFQAVLIGGIAMGGSPFQLAQTISPGATVQVSIKMAAPTNQTGVVQGTWTMTDANGVHFGDALWVTVVVRGNSKTPSPSPTITRTPG